MAGEPERTVTVTDFRTQRREERERRNAAKLRELGLPTSEIVLFKIEAMGWDMHFWHMRAELYRRLYELQRAENERLRIFLEAADTVALHNGETT